MSDSLEVTRLLKGLCEGDPSARDSFAPVLHAELKKIALRHLSHERADHTVSPTELVHDAWMQLVQPASATFENRRQFFAFASTIMRSLLVDYARRMRAARRGGGVRSLVLETNDEPVAVDRGHDLIMLDDALRRLEEIDPELARIAELRVFSGLEMVAVASLVDLPLRTAERRWTAARIWLQQELGDDR